MFDEVQYRLLTRPLIDVYPDIDSVDGPALDDYNPLLQSMGFDIVMKVDDDDYQGDSRLILRHGNFYGMLIFGWGSCSGCDALQGCRDVAEVEELRQKLFFDIHWGSARELHDWMRDRDWEVEFSFHTDGTKSFIVSALSLLDQRARSEGSR